MCRRRVPWIVLAIAMLAGCEPTAAPTVRRAEAAATRPVNVPPGAFKLSIVPMAARNVADWDEHVSAYAKARDLGCRVAHSYTLWGDVELDKGKYDWKSPEYPFILARHHGMEASMELLIINVMDLGRMPKDLQGKGLADPVLQQRWLAFLDAFGRRFKDDVKYLWLGNETDTYFHKHRAELDVWVDLLRRSVETLHRAAPGVKVGTVLTYHGALATKLTGMIDRVGPITDVVAVTYYPEMMPDGYKPDRVSQQFDDMIATYGKYRLALVETAVAVGGRYGGSEEAQVAYCRQFFQALRRHKDKLEFAGWFNVHDFSPTYARALIGGWGVKSERFAEWIGTMALADFQGRARPVYATWAEEAAKLYQLKANP